jgi:type I restriction enzyme, S subunit
MNNLPAGWEETPVGGIASSLIDGPFGSNLKSEHYQSSGVRVIRLQNIADGRFDDRDKAYISLDHFNKLNRNEARPGDVLIAALGEVLPRVCLVPPDIDRAIVKADCFRLRPYKGISANYLAYILSAPQTRKQASTEIAGVGRPRLNLRKVSALVIPVPPSAEQERIVAAIEEQFSRLDAGVAALERVQRNLKQLRTAVSEKALDTNWPQRQLRDVCLSVTDGDHQAPPQTSSGVPFLVIGNVRTGKIDFAGCRHVPLSYYETLDPKRRPQRNDVLYTVVGSYGIPAQINNDDVFCVQRHIAILRPSPEIDARYLEQVLRTSSTRRQADACATGTAQMTVPLSGLRRIHIPVPSLDEQRRIAAELEGRDALIDHLSAEIQQNSRRSVSLRSSILAAAFSGQLVAQDASDEPASVLLERIAAGPASSNGHKPTRTRKPRAPGERTTV